ncbi:MAG: acyltransferase family protein [Brevundimonas sp.]
MSETRPRPAGRDVGLDAFRGLTVLLMVLVNLQGDAATAFPWLAHAAWNGLTLADLVFPWFILAVGLSTPLAARSGPAATWGPAARRVAVLVALGVALGWLIRPSVDPTEIRWVGVLQRIALVYLVCALVARASRGPWIPAGLAIAGLAVHSLALLLVSAPGESGPSLAMGQGFSAWLDQTLVPGRLHRERWDPEGAWSTLSAIGTGLAGVALARLRAGRGPGLMAPVALGLIAVGLALTPLLPLNKALWTASYALVAVGTGLALLLALSAVMAAGRARPVTDLLVFAGRTALTVYVVHMLLIALLVRAPFGQTLWASGFQAIRGLGLADPIASLVFAVLATALTLAPIPWLRRRGWLIRA